MKKIIIICVLGFGTIHSIAQQAYSAKQDIFASTTIMKNSGTSIEDGEESSSSGILIGFRFMPTISSFDVRKTDGSTIETSAVVSYGYGGLIGANLGEHGALQAEVIYSTYAQQYEAPSGTGQIELSYINIPLMLVLNTNSKAPINLNIAFGPQLGINTGSKIDAGSAGNGTDTIHAVLSVKPSDVGIAYGAGLDFGLGESNSTKLCIGFRGVYGLVDISDQSQSITTDQYYVLDRAHVKTYSAYIGLTFGF